MFRLVLKENVQPLTVSGTGDIFKYHYKDPNKIAYILVLAKAIDIEDLGDPWYTLAVDYFGSVPKIVNGRSNISNKTLTAAGFQKLDRANLGEDKEKIESTILNRENIVNKLNSLLSTEHIDEEQMQQSLIDLKINS